MTYIVTGTVTLGLGGMFGGAIIKDAGLFLAGMVLAIAVGVLGL